MKKIIISIFLILLPLLLAAYDSIPVPFKVGEYMEFEVQAFNTTVAIQRAWVKGIVEYNGIKCYHLHIDVQTIPWVSKIYHLHDTSDEYVDVETLYPIAINSKIKEGSWTNTVKITIDREKKILSYKDKRKTKDIKYKGDVLGLTSLLYKARTMTPAKNEKITFVLSNQDQIEYIDVIVKSQNSPLTLKAINKKFKAFLYNQIGGKNVALWIANDKKRLPLRMISIKLKFAGYPVTNIEGWLTKYLPGKDPQPEEAGTESK